MNYRYSRVVGCIFILVLISACGMPMQQYRRDINSFVPLKQAQLDLPKGDAKKAESSFMVAFVRPSFDMAATASLASASSYSQLMEQNAFPYKKSDVAKEEYKKMITNTLRSDLDYILLQKSIRVLGDFSSFDEMTFDQKKRAIYAFIPSIAIYIDEKKTAETGRGYSETGQFTIRGYISLLLRETITGEKLWTKRIEAEPVSKPYQFSAKYKQTAHVMTDMDMIFTSGIQEMDTSDQGLADAISEFYAALGKKLWAHIDTEEWGKYLTQATALRNEKRY